MTHTQRIISVFLLCASVVVASSPDAATAIPNPIPVVSAGVMKLPVSPSVNAPSIHIQALSANDCQYGYYAPTYVDKQDCMKQGWLWLTYGPDDKPCQGCVQAYQIIIEHKSPGGSTESVYVRQPGLPNGGFWPKQFTLKKSDGQWTWGDCWMAKGRDVSQQIDSPNSPPQCLPSSAPVGWLPFPTPSVPSIPSRISSPSSLIIVSNPADCGKLTPDLYATPWGPLGSCESDLKAGGLWTHWTWTRVPCGSPRCLDADTFVVDHRPGAAVTLGIRARDAFFAAGKWRIGDCFVVHARNSIENVVADSNVACVPRLVVPLISPAPAKI
jgi:hypothetical protein